MKTNQVRVGFAIGITSTDADEKAIPRTTMATSSVVFHTFQNSPSDGMTDKMAKRKKMGRRVGRCEMGVWESRGCTYRTIIPIG